MLLCKLVYFDLHTGHLVFEYELILLSYYFILFVFRMDESSVTGVICCDHNGLMLAGM